VNAEGDVDVVGPAPVAVFICAVDGEIDFGGQVVFAVAAVVSGEHVHRVISCWGYRCGVRRRVMPFIIASIGQMSNNNLANFKDCRKP
jgi:hypothetical protein